MIPASIVSTHGSRVSRRFALEAGTCVGVGDTTVVFEIATGLIATPPEVSVKFDAG
jgi:hypothetical protein